MIKNVVVISDTHCGCQLGLCPPEITLDDGGIYKASKYQLFVWELWEKFWNEFVPKVTKNEDYALVINGDVIDGIHHNAVTQISHNIADQILIAETILKPIISNKKCKYYYHLRGTEAHAGQSGQFEEMLAKNLGAIPNDSGNYARWELWLRFGNNQNLCHFTHHISGTQSPAFETTALMKELIEAYSEAGRWGDSPPDCVIRSHRHRYSKVEVPSRNTNAISVCTPGWQLKTPFSYRMIMGRSALPQIGGIVLKEHEDVPVYVRQFVVGIPRAKEEII